MNKPNARFWVTHRNGWVKLTLRSGQSVEVGYSSPDEEGYSFEHSRYTYEGRVVIDEWSNGGRDCDGTIRRSGTCACDVEQLRSRDLGRDAELCGTIHEGQKFLLPQWEKAGAERVYDEYAQAAGY